MLAPAPAHGLSAEGERAEADDQRRGERGSIATEASGKVCGEAWDEQSKKG